MSKKEYRMDEYEKWLLEGPEAQYRIVPTTWGTYGVEISKDEGETWKCCGAHDNTMEARKAINEQKMQHRQSKQHYANQRYWYEKQGIIYCD